MSDVIDFLERMGADAQLRHGTQDELELALTTSEVDQEVRSAILAKDKIRLDALLGQGGLFGMMIPAKEDDDESEHENEETPSHEDDEVKDSMPSASVLAG
jgi:hypothetical protein